MNWLVCHRRRRAAQVRRVAAAHAQPRDVARDVRAVLVDDADDAEGHAHVARRAARWGARRASTHLEERVGRVGDLAQRAGHRAHPRCGRASAGPGRRPTPRRRRPRAALTSSRSSIDASRRVGHAATAPRSAARSWPGRARPRPPRTERPWAARSTVLMPQRNGRLRPVEGGPGRRGARTRRRRRANDSALTRTSPLAIDRCRRDP